MALRKLVDAALLEAAGEQLLHFVTSVTRVQNLVTLAAMKASEAPSENASLVDEQIVEELTHAMQRGEEALAAMTALADEALIPEGHAGVRTPPDGGFAEAFAMALMMNGAPRALKDVRQTAQPCHTPNYVTGFIYRPRINDPAHPAWRAFFSSILRPKA